MISVVIERELNKTFINTLCNSLFLVALGTMFRILCFRFYVSDFMFRFYVSDFMFNIDVSYCFDFIASDEFNAQKKAASSVPYYKSVIFDDIEIAQRLQIVNIMLIFYPLFM